MKGRYTIVTASLSDGAKEEGVQKNIFENVSTPEIVSVSLRITASMVGNGAGKLSGNGTGVLSYISSAPKALPKLVSVLSLNFFRMAEPANNLSNYFLINPTAVGFYLYRSSPTSSEHLHLFQPAGDATATMLRANDLVKIVIALYPQTASNLAYLAKERYQ